jgi:biopolymer transport protein ExbD
MSAPFTLPRPERRARGAAILPLINVVFLLLLFIVLTGVIRTPDPFTLTPPQAAEGQQADAADPQATLYVARSGEIRFREATGEAAALVAIAQAVAAGELATLTLRADAGVPAPRIVKLVEALRFTGAAQVQLQAERKP